MADQILTSVFDVASGLENEAASLRTGVALIYDQLHVGYEDSERVAESISKLYFVAEALEDVQKRLEHLSAAAYSLCRAAIAAEPPAA